MKKLLKIITKIVPHISIALCIMMGVLIYIDSVNTAMGFLRGNVFIIALITMCVFSFVSSIIAISKQNVDKK